MHDKHYSRFRVHFSTSGLLLLGVWVLGFAACGYQQQPVQVAETYLGQGWAKADRPFRDAAYEVERVAIPTVAGAEFVNDDELCLTCHKAYTETFAHNVHRTIREDSKCESCHGPASRHMETRGKEPGLILSFKTMTPAQQSEVCSKCHEDDACAPGAQWRTSVHAHNNVTCTDCHDSHYNVPEGTPATTEPDLTRNNQMSAALVSYLEDEPLSSLAGSSNNLNASAPETCYKCHGDMENLSHVAGPHQIGGLNGFNCTTCHDPHGRILEESRKDLCLECHKGDSPTMAWHSSTHGMVGVACTDCHSPHPDQAVQQFLNIRHTDIRRPNRRQMSVQEPEVCYKCHTDIYGKTRLPSHHPIREGKMTCSDCHDGHGQMEGNLKAETTNLVCYRCHADKEGPFAWEHAPVSEDCGICHEPHGTVENNLLRQPTTILCLRCHNGHRGFRRPIDTDPGIRPPLYTDCTQCHSQIHGTDMINQTRVSGARLTR